MRSIQTNTLILDALRATGAFLFFPKGALTHHLQAGGGILPVGQARALFTNCLSDSSPEGAGNAASGHRLCSRLPILQHQQNDEAAFCHPIPPPACENSAKNKSFGYVPQLLRSYGDVAEHDIPIFSFPKEKQKMKGQ